jgi:hypothetical protein
MTLTTGAATPRVAVGALMAALLSACVAFQLNASMLSPALAASLLIPRPRDDEAAAARRGGSGG